MKVTTIILLTFACASACCSRSRDAEPKVVEITGNNEMKFSVTRFEVKPGLKATLTLTNIGELPKEAT
jgi:azurin